MATYEDTKKAQALIDKLIAHGTRAKVYDFDPSVPRVQSTIDAFKAQSIQLKKMLVDFEQEDLDAMGQLSAGIELINPETEVVYTSIFDYLETVELPPEPEVTEEDPEVTEQ